MGLPVVVTGATLGKDDMATEATESTFDSEVIGSDGKVLVDFWAEWCGPCHAVAPVLDRIAEERNIKLVKVNIDNEQGLASRRIQRIAPALDEDAARLDGARTGATFGSGGGTNGWADAEKFSIAASCLTSTFFPAMRLAPCESVTVMITGSSSGVSPTASASAKRNDWSTGR